MIHLKDISYKYPFQDKNALESVTQHIRRAETVLCTGPSGCGKSTLIRLINGLAPHYYKGNLMGSVHVNNIDNAARNINDISKHVGTLFQDPEHQFFALKVEDELVFAHECRGTKQERIAEILSRMMDKFSLEGLKDSEIFDLSEGEKQKVALASIVSLSPEVIILDEPTANLDPEAATDLANMLGALKDEGITIFIVDHRLYWLKDLVDRVLILLNGRIASHGNFSILEDEKLISENGLRRTDVEDPRGTLPRTVDAEGSGIRLEDVTFAYKGQAPIFQSINTFLPLGKVVAVTGRNGAGKTTFARLLTGLIKMQSGRILLDGKPVSPAELLRRSSVVLQNTDHQLHMKTVKSELEISAGDIPVKDRKRKIDEMLDLLDLKEFADRHPQSLSGGQKQRLVIACGMIKTPDILILDEPTSGLDGKNMRVISRMMRKLAERGACVLVITHDLELIDAACSCELQLPF